MNNNNDVNNNNNNNNQQKIELAKLSTLLSWLITK